MVLIRSALEEYGEEGEVGGRDAFEAAGLAEGSGAEAVERLAGLGPERCEGGVIDVDGEALGLEFGSATDIDALALEDRPPPSLDERVAGAIEGARRFGTRIKLLSESFRDQRDK